MAPKCGNLEKEPKVKQEQIKKRENKEWKYERISKEKENIIERQFTKNNGRTVDIKHYFLKIITFSHFKHLSVEYPLLLLFLFKKLTEEMLPFEIIHYFDYILT